MEQTRTLKIVWFSFMASVAMFQLVGFVGSPPDRAIEPVMYMAIGICAAGSAAFGWVGVPRFLWRQEAQNAFIIRYALYESVAIYGVMLCFMGGGLLPSLLAGVATWMLLLLSFPTEERFTAWEVRRLGDGL